MTNTVSSYVTLLLGWVEKNPNIAIPALISAAAVLAGYMLNAIAALFAAVLKAVTDVFITVLNRQHAKGDPRHRKLKSPSR